MLFAGAVLQNRSIGFEDPKYKLQKTILLFPPHFQLTVTLI